MKSKWGTLLQIIRQLFLQITTKFLQIATGITNNYNLQLLQITTGQVCLKMCKVLDWPPRS